MLVFGLRQSAVILNSREGFGEPSRSTIVAAEMMRTIRLPRNSAMIRCGGISENQVAPNIT